MSWTEIIACVRHGAEKPLPRMHTYDPTVLDVVDRVVDGITNGSDITATFPKIAQLVHAQDQRAEILDQLLLTHDYERLRKLARARDCLEERLIQMANHAEGLPPDYVIELRRDLSEIVEGIRKRVSGQSSPIGDIQGLLEKIDFSASGETDVSLKKRFSATSQQGREVVRKLLLRVNQAVLTATDGDESESP